MSASISIPVVQANHGFSRGTPVRFDGTNWVIATTGIAGVGIVGKVTSQDSFEFTTSGEVTGLTGLTPGTTYYPDGDDYLSATENGIAIGVAYTATILHVTPPAVASSSTATDTSAFATHTQLAIEAAARAAADAAEIARADAAYLNDPGSAGIVVRTTANDTVARALMADASITVTDGDGQAGDPSLSRAALTGDVTAPAGDNATTISADAVTYAKMQNVSAADRVLGRGDSGAGDPEEITLGTNLEMSGTTLNALDSLTPQSTGILTGGVLSIGTGGAGVATTFSISAGTGQIVDNTVDPITLTNISWATQTDVAITNLLTQLVTYVAIDSGGNIVQSAVDFTPQQQRTHMVIGVVVHSDFTVVNAVNQTQVVAYAPGGQANDLMYGLGIFNVSGNVFSANGANRKLNKSAGYLFRRGSNYTSLSDDPHVKTTGALVQAPLRMQNQSGAGSASTTDVDVANYDVGGVTTAVSPANRFTILHIYLFQSNLVAVQRGQAVYHSLAEAKAAVQTEAYVTNPVLASNGLLRGFLIARANATDLSDPNEAYIMEAGKFGGTAGAGGISVSTLQNAYDNGTTPEILTNSTRGALTVKRGSAADTDAVLEVQNGAGATTFEVDGDGTVTGSNLSGTNTGDQTITLTGDVTGSGTGSFAATIANDAVTNAKAANMPASTIKGNNTGGAADPIDLTVAQTKTLLAITAADVSGVVPSTRAINVTAPITGGGDLSADRTIGFDSTADLDNNARIEVFDNGVSVAERRGLNLIAGTNITLTVTDVPAGERVSVTIDAATGGSGLADPGANGVVVRTALNTTTARDIAVGAGGSLSVSNGSGVSGNPTLSRAALTGDVTASADSNATTIANDAVTYAKMQNVSAADRLLGRGNGGGAGDPEELTLGAGLALTTTVLGLTSALARMSSLTPVAVTGATSATLNRWHVVSGTSADYTITISGLSPATGDIVGFYVKDYAAASKQFKLDASGTVKIAGRTRYLVLLHTNCVVLQWDGTDWQPLVKNLDTPWIDAGASTVTATTTNPTKGGGTTYDKVYWRRSGKDLCVRYEYRHTTAGTAGSGDYLWTIPIGTIDTAFVTAETTVGTLNARATSGVGHGAADTNGAFNGTLVITPSVYDGTRLRAGYFSSTSALFMASGTTPFSGATLRFHFAAAVPMTDW